MNSDTPMPVHGSGSMSDDFEINFPLSNENPLQIESKTEFSVGNTDVLYVLGTGSRWNNNEIRFSLRSIEKYLSGYRNIFIVGAPTPFLKNVINIPCEDIFPPEINADGNIITKVLKACHDERLSDNFLFINDDHIITQPMHIDKIPAFHKGNMLEFNAQYFQTNYWRTRLGKTMEALKEYGLPANHYDCHCPILFNKRIFRAVMCGFDYAEGIGLTMKSLYGNFVYKDKNTLLTNEKIIVFQNFSYSQLKIRLAQCQFMAFNDNGINDDLKVWLSEQFPDCSSFENEPLQDRTIEIKQWLMSDRDFNQGAELFKRFFHHPNLITLFASGETSALRNKLEFKMKMTLHDIK